MFKLNIVLTLIVLTLTTSSKNRDNIKQNVTITETPFEAAQIELVSKSVEKISGKIKPVSITNGKIKVTKDHDRRQTKYSYIF